MNKKDSRAPEGLDVHRWQEAVASRKHSIRMLNGMRLVVVIFTLVMPLKGAVNAYIDKRWIMLGVDVFSMLLGVVALIALTRALRELKRHLRETGFPHSDPGEGDREQT